MSCSRILAATGAAITRPSPQAPSRNWLWSLWHRIRHMQECGRQRRALRELDDRALADIGVSREAASQEAKKRFWTLLVTGRC